MINQSVSILTRGRSSTVYTSGITPITSGFIVLEIEYIPPIPPIEIEQGGGRSGRKIHEYPEEKEKKKIRITLYINNEKYVKEKIVDADVKVSMDNILIE